MLSQLLLATGFAAATMASAPQPIRVQFAKGVTGQNVTISIDGKTPRTTFAGKLGFRSQTSSWQSVCADVRSPIRGGQFFSLRPMSSLKAGGRIALAGNIVAKYFNAAQTPDECAGLQLAVWEAVEDGGIHANFGAGRFRARATTAALDFAQDFYEAIQDAQQEAAFLQSAGGGGGQSQLSSTT
jgi:hypothetical protein